MASEDHDKGGRPSKYQPEFIDQAEKLCRRGFTDREIADFFRVTERTLNRWKILYPDFCQALKRGKDTADAMVERSLFERATGYTYSGEKVFQFQGAVVRAKVKVHHPPDVTAQIFWLKNRQKELWRAGPDGGGDEKPGADRIVVVHGGVPDED